MKTNAIVRIILFSLGIVILVSILGGVILFKKYAVDFRNKAHHEEIGNLPVVSDGSTNQGVVDPKIRNIEIDWVSGSITVQPDANCTDIVITETGTYDEKYAMVYRTNGDTLEIQYSKESIRFPSFGITSPLSKDLMITVPESWVCNSLEIDTASANVALTGLTIDEFDFNGASGICDITDCHVDKLDLDTASGDITFEGTLNYLDCDAASATCRISVSNNPQSIDIDTASGNLELTLPESCGFTCSMETLSGRFSSDLETVHKNGRYVHGDGACNIHVNAMSGDISIRKHHISTNGDAVPDCTDKNCTITSHGHSSNH